METPRSSNGRLPAEIRTLLVVIGGGTAAAWLIALCGALLRWGYPYNWPLYPNDLFDDYSVYFQAFSLLHRSEFFTQPNFPFMYFPPAVLLYRFFYLFSMRGGFLVYLGIVLAAVRFGLKPVFRAMLRRGFAVRPTDDFLMGLALTSYPMIFCLQRGNLEVILAIGMALGTWAYCSGKTWWAAVLWGMFGAVKLYPLLLLAIFLRARQYRQMLAAIGAALTTMLLALLYTGPTLRIALAGTQLSLHNFTQLYILRARTRALVFDHSLFALVKFLLHPSGVEVEKLLHGYFLVVGAIMLVLYFGRVWKLPFANQLLFLSVASILIPPVSFDYTLLQLYAPLMVLIFLVMDQRPAHMTPVFVVMGLLFTPTNFLFLHGETRQGQIKSVLLLTLMFLALRRPFGSTERSPSVAESVSEEEQWASELTGQQLRA